MMTPRMQRTLARMAAAPKVSSIACYESDTESDVDIADARDFLLDLDFELDAYVDVEIEAATYKNRELRAQKAYRTGMAASLSQVVERLKGEGGEGKRRKYASGSDVSWHETKHRRGNPVNFDSIDAEIEDWNRSQVSFSEWESKQDKLKSIEADNHRLDEEIEDLAAQITALRRQKLSHEPWRKRAMTRAEYTNRTGGPSIL